MSDPFADYVTYLVPFEQDEIYPTMIRDYSPARGVVSLTGSASLSTTRAKAGTCSLGTNIGSNNSSGVLLSSGNCTFGTGDFTVEGWSYVTSHFNYQPIWFSQSENKIGMVHVGMDSTGRIYMGMYFGTRPYVSSPPGVVPLNQWFHWAGVRWGGMCYIYLNGVSQATPVSIPGELTAHRPVIGFNPDYGWHCIKGWVDLFRITKAARYTSDFTPPTSFEYASYKFPMDAVGSLGVNSGQPWQPFKAYPVGPMLDQNPSKAYGLGRIVATVKEKGTPTTIPVVRRVVLHRHRDDMPVAETWSSESGAYAFTEVDMSQNYYVVSFDHTGNYRAVIADNLVPERMS